MNKSNALKVMATLAAAVMGEEKFNATSPEFQKQAVDGASLVDSIKASANEFDEEHATSAWTPEDCQALFNLISSLQQVQREECPIA